MPSTRISRRSILKSAALGSAAAISAPYVSGVNAAGTITMGCWDHWVPGANKALDKITKEWGDKNKVEIHIDYITSQGEKDKLTAAAEAQAGTGHDIMSHRDWNIRIHGITPDMVADAPGWVEQLADLVEYAEDDILVAHNAGFDMGVIKAACTATGIQVPEYRYLCSLQVARKTYHLDSYRLPVVAMAAGFEDFPHHDAVADSEACAAIMIHAADRYGAIDLPELADLAGVRLSVLQPPLAAAG